MLPRTIYTFNAIPIKIPLTFFRVGTNHLRICVESEKTPNSQGNIKKENQNARFQAVLQSCDHQDNVILAQKQIIDQWNRIENPEMGPQLYGQLMFDKTGKNIHWIKDNLFNQWCWENWTATCRRMKLDHCLSPYTKINSKWMKDLNVRQESIKILEENTSNTLFELGQATSRKTHL